MKKILIPTDFSPASRNACKYAASFAKPFGAEIQLLHVYMQPVSVAETPFSWEVFPVNIFQKENEERIGKEIEFLQKNYSAKVIGTATTGYTGTTIKDVAEEERADLIIMAAKSGKRSKILGSTVLKMIRNTNIPVLAIPEGVSYQPIKNLVFAIDFHEMIDHYCLDVMLQIIKKFNASLDVLHIDEIGAEMKASEVPEKLQLGIALSKLDYYYDRVEQNDVRKGIEKFVDNHPTDLLVMIAHHHNVFERAFGTIYTSEIGFEIKHPLLILKTDSSS